MARSQLILIVSFIDVVVVSLDPCPFSGHPRAKQIDIDRFGGRKPRWWPRNGGRGIATKNSYILAGLDADPEVRPGPCDAIEGSGFDKR